MNIKSVTRWLVMTEFEMLLNVLGVFIFTVLLCLKIDLGYDLSWRYILMPMFVADAMQAYFCIIVFLRQFFEFQTKPAILRFIISSLFLATRLLFKLFVYLILTGNKNDENNKFRFHYATFPLFLHLTLLMFRSCCLKKYKILN